MNLKEQLTQIRSSERITPKQIIDQLFTDQIELHGDRVLGDDLALIGGIAMFNNQPITFLATDRGRTITERRARHGGAVSVNGYRKALRLVQQAEKFQRSVIAVIDIPGADASVYSEDNGQSKAIADMIQKMGRLRVPNITVISGEGHSGGALAFANSNRVIMFEKALFSVAAPEAVRAIVSIDDDVNDYLPMTANDLKRRSVIDEIAPEDGNELKTLTTILEQDLAVLRSQSPENLIKQRLNRYQNLFDIN